MENANIVSLAVVENAEQDWLDLFNMIDLLDSEVKRRLGKFDDHSFTSLKVIQELVSTAKSIAKGQWKGIHILTKLQSTGVARSQ